MQRPCRARNEKLRARQRTSEIHQPVIFGVQGCWHSLLSKQTLQLRRFLFFTGSCSEHTCLCSSITPVTNSQYCAKERLFAEPPLPAWTKSHALAGLSSSCSASLLRCAANCSAGKVRYGAFGSIIDWPISRKKHEPNQDCIRIPAWPIASAFA